MATSWNNLCTPSWKRIVWGAKASMLSGGQLEWKHLLKHTHTTENSSKCSILQDTPWYFKVWDKCLCITVSSWKVPTLLSQNLLAEQVVLILSGYNSNCLEGSQSYYWRDLYRFPPSKLKPVQHQNRIWKPYVFMHSTKVTKEYHKLDRNITITYVYNQIKISLEENDWLLSLSKHWTNIANTTMLNIGPVYIITWYKKTKNNECNNLLNMKLLFNH